MQDVLTRAAQLNRPKLLVRTAKSAANHYRREVHLARLFPGKTNKHHSAAIHMLLDLETQHNNQRIHHGAGYSWAEHLDVLIALVGEIHLLTEHRKDPS